uniref:Uncharacterized protein n=1 Tax=Arundo donax TaxID=35708 RepID=A0A0A9AJU4_ARUDO
MQAFFTDWLMWNICSACALMYGHPCLVLRKKLSLNNGFKV